MPQEKKSDGGKELGESIIFVYLVFPSTINLMEKNHPNHFPLFFSITCDLTNLEVLKYVIWISQSMMKNSMNSKTLAFMLKGFKQEGPSNVTL